MKKMVLAATTIVLLMGMLGCGGSQGASASSTSADSAGDAAVTQSSGDNQTASTAGTVSADKKPVTITFWHRDGNATSNPIYHQLIEDFQAQYPWITVEYTGLTSSDYMQKLNTAVVTGSTPDVGTISAKDVYTLATQDALLELDESFETWAERDLMFDNIIEQSRWFAPDGKLYTLGYGKTQETSWYNKAWHDEQGIEPALTIDELVAYCDEYAKDDKYYFSLRGGAGSTDNMLMFILSYGGKKVLFEEDGTCVLDDPKVIAGLDVYADLFKDNKVSKDSISNGYREMVAEFGSGVAQYIQHNSSSVSEHETNLGIGNFMPVRPLAGPDGVAVCKAPGFMGASVFKSTEHPEESLLFAQYLASAEGAGYVCEKEGRVPVNAGVFEQDWYNDNLYFRTYAEYEEDPALVFIQFPNYLTGYGEYDSTVIQADIQAVLMGTITAEEACSKWAADLTVMQKEYLGQ